MEKINWLNYHKSSQWSLSTFQINNSQSVWHKCEKILIKYKLSDQKKDKKCYLFTKARLELTAFRANNSGRANIGIFVALERSFDISKSGSMLKRFERKKIWSFTIEQITNNHPVSSSLNVQLFFLEIAQTWTRYSLRRETWGREGSKISSFHIFCLFSCRIIWILSISSSRLVMPCRHICI